jgi:hypothetical protein
VLDLEEEGERPDTLGSWMLKKQENPVIADWVRGSGGSTEGLLGGRLAQRQAALRGKKAAGHGQLFGLFRACRLCPQHFACQKIIFLEMRIDWILGKTPIRCPTDLIVSRLGH